MSEKYEFRNYCNHITGLNSKALYCICNAKKNSNVNFKFEYETKLRSWMRWMHLHPKILNDFKVVIKIGCYQPLTQRIYFVYYTSVEIYAQQNGKIKIMCLKLLSTWLDIIFFTSENKSYLHSDWICHFFHYWQNPYQVLSQMVNSLKIKENKNNHFRLIYEFSYLMRHNP